MVGNRMAPASHLHCRSFKVENSCAKLKMSEPHLVDMQVAEGSCI